MKIAFFGGTFDPVHLGHLAVARSAVKKFGLNLVYFAAADIPPHKQKRAITDFQHRFAMLALATAGEKQFVPSLINAPTGQPNYSYETMLRLKQELQKSDKLYFLIGMDAFKEIATWHKPVELLGECDFIVVSRPGYSLADAARALPEPMRSGVSDVHKMTKRQSGEIKLQHTTVYLLDDVHEPASSTDIRSVARESLRKLRRYVPAAVAEYIKKEGLYIERSSSAKSSDMGKC